MIGQHETCMNCGRVIGTLETPRIYNGKVVCFACDDLLRRQASMNFFNQDLRDNHLKTMMQQHPTRVHVDKPSGLSTAAMIMSFLGYLIWPCAILAIIFAIAAGGPEENRRTRSRATASLVFGVISLVITGFVWLVIIGSMSH